MLLVRPSARLMLMQDLVQDRVERDEPELAALADEPDLPTVEVDLVPAEPDDLAEAKSSEGEQEEGDLLSLRSDRGVDRPQLLVAVGGWLDVRQPRQLHVCGWIASDEVVADAVPVCRPHVREMPTHGRDGAAVEQLFEVLLALKKREFGGGDLVLVEPALGRAERVVALIVSGDERRRCCAAR
jgi:hypothetical protein